MISEWRSVIAKHYTQRGRTHGAGFVRQWFPTAEPLRKRRYEKWNTQYTHDDKVFIKIVTVTLTLTLSR